VRRGSSAARTPGAAEDSSNDREVKPQLQTSLAHGLSQTFTTLACEAKECLTRSDSYH
jgi:hypothetical protein